MLDIMKPVKVVSEFKAIIPDLSANEKKSDSSLLRELRKFASALLGQMLLYQEELTSHVMMKATPRSGGCSGLNEKLFGWNALNFAT